MAKATNSAKSSVSPKSVPNKQERAYELIRNRIAVGIYGPGQRLIIDSLARDLEISQVPIREAIRKLEAEGWVHYHRNSGPEVANVSREQWQATMEVLAVLEGYATALAAGHVTAKGLARMAGINSEMEDALKEFDLLRLSRCNRQFHRAIYVFCPSPYLVERIEETQAKIDAIRGTLFPSVPQRSSDSIAEHAHILQVIRDKEPFEVVERVAREHKLNFLRAAVKQLDQMESGRS